MADLRDIAKKWQRNGKKTGFRANENQNKKKSYILNAALSFNRLHMGHLRNYSIGDVIAV